MSLSKPNILLFDIETAPCKSYVWSLWQEIKNYSFITNDWYVLCWCAKWLGEEEIMSGSLIDKKAGSEDDKKIMKDLHKLLDKADIVIAHNGKKFDVRKVNTRLIYHGLNPVSPFTMIDTLTVARSNFSFTSNRLNDLGVFLDEGKKIDTGGFGLWEGCLNGDKSSWNKMVEYCKQDVALLERVYLRLRPFIKNHPNTSVVSGTEKSCPKCTSTALKKRGFYYTNTSVFQRYQCSSCGGWCSERDKHSETRKTLKNV